MAREDIRMTPAKRRIGLEMLDRYTGSDASQFRKRVILTNFHKYASAFAKRYKCSIVHGTTMECVHSPAEIDISLVNFNIGAPNAAVIIELLSLVNPEAVVFMGLCGGLHHSIKVGDYILPMAAIRDDGVSDHFMPKNVPALPTFKLQKFISQILVERKIDYRTGVVHTTNYRFWEFNYRFKQELKKELAIGIEMECATLFSVGFSVRVPIGALLLVSDLPLIVGGLKTKKSSQSVFERYGNEHLEIAIKSLTEISKRGEKTSLRHFLW